MGEQGAVAAVRVSDSTAVTDRLRAERKRIARVILEQVEGLAQRAVTAMQGEIPAYATRGEAFIADVTDQTLRNYRANLVMFLEDRTMTLEDITFVRGAAMRRARAGFALEDYLNAYRVGQQIFWEAIVDTAADTSVGRKAALSLATELMQYIDFTSTHAGRAYVEFQQYAIADADRERRDLLEHLLGGEMPERGPLLTAAQGYGIGPAARMMVAVAVSVGPVVDADAPHAASATIARAALRETKTLVVVRQAEIVAVPGLDAGVEPAAVCERLALVQQRLSQEGTPLAVGVSTVAVGVEALPRAYLEARAALALVGDDGGVAALPQLSPFDYLTLRADDTSRRLVDERLQTFLDEDRQHGGVLTATVRALVSADLNLRVAAERLGVHPNTAQYRLRRVEERTGRSPRHISDLFDLLVAIALNESHDV